MGHLCTNSHDFSYFDLISGNKLLLPAKLWSKMLCVFPGRTYGEESNIPVLCIHGRSDNLETFAYLIPLLPQQFFYVCIDLPGHGRSAPANVGYILDLPWYTLSVKRVIDYFNWSKICLLGHSFGGHISFLLSAIYPELVLKLIILDSLAMSTVPNPSIASIIRTNYFDITLNLEKRLNSDKAPTYTLEDFVQKMKNIRLTEVTTEQLKKMAERSLKEVGENQYKFCNDQRTKMLGLQSHVSFQYYENIAKDIRCPILLILGRNSLVTRSKDKRRRNLLEKNKKAVIRVIDGDHDIQLARPHEVAQLVVPFLAKHTKSKL